MMTAFNKYKKTKIDTVKGEYMKALIIGSVLFFSLRAMSSELGEDQKSECPYASQTNLRQKKVVEPIETESTKEEGSVKAISK